MPFTATHVLAIMPLAAIRRQPFPLSALVIGSMIPDWPMFVPWSPGYHHMHSLAGLLTACLPLGLACFFVFEGVLKRPLFALLPQYVQHRCVSRLGPAVDGRFRSLLVACLAILIGAASHQLWDTFTHAGRWGTQVLPALQTSIVTVWGQDIPGYKLLQIGSTLMGLPLLVMWLGLWLGRQEPSPLPPALMEAWRGERYFKTAAWILALLLFPIAVGWTWYTVDAAPYGLLVRSVTRYGLLLMGAVVIYALMFHALRVGR